MTTSANSTQFESLLAPHQDVLERYVRRLVGHRADAEDLIQDVKLKALERLPTLRAEGAFRGWLFTIATNACRDHLRKQQRWRPYSQPYIEEKCAADASQRQQVVDATEAPEYSFDVREHISFCFTCVGRSLEPTEAASVMLREVLGFTNREAAQVLGLTESVLRHHLSSARRAMEKTFEGMCSLINKDGVCRQCSSFRQVAPDGRRGPSLPVLDDRGDQWPARLAVVRSTHFHGGKSAPLHDVLFALIKELESAAKPTPTNQQ